MEGEADVRVDFVFVEVTWKRALKVWWSLMWRGLLFGFLAGAALGMLTGVILAMAGATSETVMLVGRIEGVMVGVLVGIAVTKHVLGKRFSEFRIALVQEHLTSGH